MKAKNLFSMAALALVGACISACSGSDEIVAEQPVQPTGGPIVIKGELAPKGGETRSTVNDDGVATWSSGDQIAIVQTSNPTQKVIATVSVGNTSEFSATLPDNSWLSKEVKLIYPASCENMDLVNNTVFSTEGIESQGGTQASLSNWDICVGTMTLPGVLPTSVNGVYNVGSVTLYPQMAVCKFTLQTEGGEAINPSELSINVISGEEKIAYTLTGPTSNVVYVAMKPVSEANLSIFTSPIGNKAYGTVLNTKTLQEGYIYNTTLQMDVVGMQLWENGPIWATMNVGATKEYELGYYFQWGDVSGREENPDSYTSNNDYWWTSYRHSQISSNVAWGDESVSPNLTKYCYTSSSGLNGYTDQLMTLELEDDAARYNWGDRWRIPTKEEFEALLEHCDYETINDGATYDFQDVLENGYNGGYNNSGINGLLIQGRGAYSQNSIFLPWAGEAYSMIGEYQDQNVGWVGRYWTSTLTTNSSDLYPNSDKPSQCAYFFYTDYSSYPDVGGYEERYRGFKVRPVMDISF